MLLRVYDLILLFCLEYVFCDECLELFIKLMGCIIEDVYCKQICGIYLANICIVIISYKFVISIFFV